MKAKKLLALAGVSVAGAFLLAACGGGSSNQATYSFVYSSKYLGLHRCNSYNDFRCHK